MVPLHLWALRRYAGISQWQLLRGAGRTFASTAVATAWGLGIALLLGQAQWSVAIGALSGAVMYVVIMEWVMMPNHFSDLARTALNVTPPMRPVGRGRAL